MRLSTKFVTELRRLTPREKAALADHLWREAEPKLGLTAAQQEVLDARVAKAVAEPAKLKPVGDALRRLRR